MLKKWLRKKGSAYLMAIGVLGVLTIVGVMVSKMTTSGRWNTILTSNEKRAEECAEAASNMAFKIVKDNMNDYNCFWKLFSKPTELLHSWFLYFRLPAMVAQAYCDPISFKDAKANGFDVQLDLFNNALFKPLYEVGMTYIYDTVSPDPKAPLAPLKSMCESMGGRVRITTTGRIKKAFGILADGPDYIVGGVEVPLRKVTGFLSNIFDKVKIKGTEITTKVEGKLGKSLTSDENEQPNIDLLNFLPDKPLLKAPDISDWTVIVEGAPAPIGWLLQPLLDKIFAKICEAADLTPQGLAKKIFKDTFQFSIDFSAITDRIEEAIHNCLPECLQAFAGNISWDVTVEKQGVFEIETVVEYTPNYPDGKTIVKKLITQREFRVADIQPIAPDYTFFLANSTLLYENAGLENADNWAGDDEISWNDGNGDMVIHNMPSLKEIWGSIKNLFSFDLKELCRELQLPGLVRVNGTHKMPVKITMFPKFALDVDILKKMEIVSLLLGHKEGNTDCHGSHPSDDSDDEHNVIPGMDSVTYNFLAKGKPFDWGYFGGGSPGGNGSYWLPIPPRFGRTLLFGNFHLEFPFSLRTEGYLTKVYSHIKMLLVKIYIPPIPIIGFLGMDIPIPWFWATAHEEPYGFCRYPPYEKEDDAKEAWDPKEAGNLPANIYSPAQYLKKASYFYNSSAEFNKDIDNRSIEYNGQKTFICDGVTFVNDNLRLKKMHVMGRGMIISAANIHIDGDITREDFDKDGNATIFSIVARNGAIISGFSKRSITACCFADRGVQIPMGGGLTIHGNLCVNRFNRSDINGDLDVYYESCHCRSSLLSMIKLISKYDPTRYYVTFSSKLSSFQFVKPH